MSLLHWAATLQDKSLEVVVESSKLGVICNLMDPVSHPSALADLPTPSGTPFRAVPEGFDGPLTGCAVHFFPPGPDKVPGMGQASASIRHGGSEIAFSVTGEAGWMREERTEEEWVASLEASLPHLPRAWLRRTAQAARDRAKADELRVRCAPQLAETYQSIVAVCGKAEIKLLFHCIATS